VVAVLFITAIDISADQRTSAVLQKVQYEDRGRFNSTYEEGDWNGADEFDSSNWLLAFQAGVHEQPAALRSSDLVVRTGRTSCRDPNLQQLPRAGGLSQAASVSPRTR
jgi:hypothetical protein